VVKGSTETLRQGNRPGAVSCRKGVGTPGNRTVRAFSITETKTDAVSVAATGDDRRCRPKEKAARRRPLNSNLLIADQAAINAGFDFRRYAMKPTPAKPRIIMAQVEGSGTALIVADTRIS
jgi:hypothetical protein